MIIIENQISAVRFEELLRGNVEAEILVEDEFFARQGVDEGRDDFEEAPYIPGDCQRPCLLVADE